MKVSREQKHQVNRTVHALTERLRAVMTDEALQAAGQGAFVGNWRPGWWPIAADVSTPPDDDLAGVAE